MSEQEQLSFSLFAEPEILEVPLTADILYSGPRAKEVAFEHHHLPRRPARVGDDQTWLWILDYADELIRWSGGRARLADCYEGYPREPGGRSATPGPDLWHTSKGIESRLEDRSFASWDQIIVALKAREFQEPAVAKARDLARGYVLLAHFASCYERDFLGHHPDPTTEEGQRVVQIAANSATAVIELGGDPRLIAYGAPYGRAGVLQALQAAGLDPDAVTPQWLNPSDHPSLQETSWSAIQQGTYTLRATTPPAAAAIVPAAAVGAER